ncbi:MAG TPA: ABC transporter permease [Candidatus Sulfomarinibacteraceae bacterium]|nr:ABC transporter permease [Candidatus Sulfomarinibacteraceae bacterium]
MSRTRVFAVARRIAQGFRRDERTLGLMFVVPIVVTALLGWVLRDAKDATVNVVIVNQAGAPGQRIVDALITVTTGAPDGVEVVSWTDSPDAAEDQLRSDEADIAVVVPASLLADVGAGRRPVLTVITAGTDPGADGARLGALQGLMATVAGEIGKALGAKAVVPEVVRETIFLSPDADNLDVLAPVFLGYFAYFFVFLLTGISFLRERVGGTLERLLATPVTRGEIVLGYSLGFGIFATIQVVALTLFVLARIDVPSLGPIPAFTIGLDVASAGSPFLAFLLTVVLSLGAVSLGIFLSTFARTELQVIQFIPLVIVPQGLLGGIFWPVERLPDVLQAVAAVLPMTYAVDGLREVMLEGADLGSSAVQADLAVLAAIALLFVALAARTIKREVA